MVQPPDLEQFRKELDALRTVAAPAGIGMEESVRRTIEQLPTQPTAEQLRQLGESLAEAQQS